MLCCNLNHIPHPPKYAQGVLLEVFGGNSSTDPKELRNRASMLGSEINALHKR